MPGRERTILAAEEHAPRIAQQPLGRIGDGGEAQGPAGAAPERPAAENQPLQRGRQDQQRIHSLDPPVVEGHADAVSVRSEEHTSELQSLMRISYAVFCLKKKQKE